MLMTVCLLWVNEGFLAPRKPTDFQSVVFSTDNNIFWVPLWGGGASEMPQGLPRTSVLPMLGRKPLAELVHFERFGHKDRGILDLNENV